MFLKQAVLNNLESQNNVLVLNLKCLGARSLDGALGAAEAYYSRHPSSRKNRLTESGITIE